MVSTDRDRERERQTERGRERDGERGRETGRQREEEREMGRERDRKRGREMGREREIGRDREREGEREREREPYLGLGYDGLLGGVGAEEGGQGRRHHDGVRADEAAEVTAGDGVLLCLHHQRIHGDERVPGQPHRALLAEEGGALETQSQRGAAVRYQVKPGGQRRASFSSLHTHSSSTYSP